MKIYQEKKQKLLQVSNNLAGLLDEASALFMSENRMFSTWRNTCGRLGGEIHGDIIRIAVVGAVKSGKSTFINSMLNGDYLKRGAGILTAVVTRIRRGDNLSAKLYFKAWDQINADIRKAMSLLPPDKLAADFDMRRSADRTKLSEILSGLDTEMLIADGLRHPASALPTHYLRGFERVCSLVGPDRQVLEYDAASFAEHRKFAGDDDLAVYLEDMLLEIDNDWDFGIEIADCQGSDSPNPLHLARIQDYLLRAHFLIYVISSRTGLRQADFKLLAMIREMGILENIVFVINCDLSEHESLEDLTVLIGRIKESLCLVCDEPQIFTLSALCNLFRSSRSSLSKKDQARLEQWERERDLTEFSNRQTELFAEAFDRKIAGERYALLLKNHLERLRIIAAGFHHQIGMHRDLIGRDTQSAMELVDKIRIHQKWMQQIKSMLKSTLEGAVQQIRQEQKKSLDRFFDFRSGPAAKDVVDFIRSFSIPEQNSEKDLKAAGFSGAMCLAFHEFRQSLDAFMVERFNPRVAGHVRMLEKEIVQAVEAIAGPYENMLNDALDEYNRTLESFSIPGIAGVSGSGLRNIEMIKELAGLQLPPATAVLRYSAKIKGEAFIRLGFYALFTAFKRLLRKTAFTRRQREVMALKDGMIRLKRDTERSIEANLTDYRENLKFQYLYKLIDAVAENLYETLFERFQAIDKDLAEMVDQIGQKGDDKRKTITALCDLEQRSAQNLEAIERLRDGISELLQNALPA